MNTVKTLIVLLLITSINARAVNSSFSYQGQLFDDGAPANGQYDVSIKAYDDTIGGTQLGNTSVHGGVTVSGGLFTIESVNLGGNIYDGFDMWLEISVKKTTDAGFTVLNPMQKIKSVPYANTLIDKGAVDGQVLTFDEIDGWRPANAISGTDNQNIESMSLTGTILKVGIESGSSDSVDLISLQDGTGTDNQDIDEISLIGTLLKVGIENGNIASVDLGSLQDGTGTDSQDLSLTGTTLDITGGTSASFAGWDTDASDDVVYLNDLSDARSDDSYNLFIGDHAGENIDTYAGALVGLSNTAVGNRAIELMESGNFNTAIGFNALRANEESGNTIVGAYSFGFNETGSRNTSLGLSAGFNNVSGAGNVFIGANSAFNELGSNKLYIENSSSETPLIGGDFNTDEVIINGDLEVTGRITAPVSGIADMKAYMYGKSHINGGGSAFSSTSGFGIVRLGPGLYRVTFNSVLGLGYIANVTVVGNAPYFATTSGVSTHMDVYIWDLNGANVDAIFSFVIFNK